MNKLYKTTVAVLMVGFLIYLTGCKKFLDEKTNKKLAVPGTLADLQALLDNPSKVNSSSPSAGEISSDDYYLTDANWAALSSLQERRMYTWESDYLFPNGFNDWLNMYNTIYICNTTLKEMEKIPRSVANAMEWDNVKGQALFCRANSYLDGVSVWCLAYDKPTSETDLGMPLRLNTNFNERSERADVHETYSSIIKDATASIPLLPVIPLSKFRPSKPAAYGLLARTYLSMRDYENALKYADSCLSLKSNLIDFNTLPLNDSYPFSIENNTEAIYYKFMSTPYIILDNTPIVLPGCYDSFGSADLRKQAFFKKNPDNTYQFKGSYGGYNGPFTGLATNEMFLIKAECLARSGKIVQSMSVLNGLLIKRWNKLNIYIPYAADVNTEALNIILTERRKELMRRGLRWMDIKRLNKEGANISLTRNLNGLLFKLLSNDLRFALPIPEDVISLSGMIQNRR